MILTAHLLYKSATFSQLFSAIIRAVVHTHFANHWQGIKTELRAEFFPYRTVTYGNLTSTELRYGLC